jgi:hypothetical protein
MYLSDYRCSNCHRSVEKSSRHCPHCGICLSGIKCSFCGFVGSEGDFILDRCPKCRFHVDIPKYSSLYSSSTTSNYSSSLTSTSFSKSKQSPPKKCPQCHTLWDSQFCENCGKTSWFKLILNMIWLGIMLTIISFMINFAITDSEEILWAMYIIFFIGVLFVFILLLYLIIDVLTRRRKYIIKKRNKIIEENKRKSILDLLKKGIQSIKKSEYKAALHFFNKVLSIDPKNKDAYYLKAFAYNKQSDNRFVLKNLIAAAQLNHPKAIDILRKKKINFAKETSLS